MANITDSFNRADATSLGTADSGQTWANFGGGTLKIATNQAAVGTQNGTLSGAQIPSGGTISDGTLQVTVVSVAVLYSGPVFRYTDASNFFDVVPTSASAIALRKVEAGTATTLASATGLTIAANDVFVVELSGSSIVVKQNGVQIISATSTFNQTATGFGLKARTGAIYDDFSWTESAPTAGTPDHLAFSQQPVGGTSGSVLPTQPKVDVLDSAGVLVTTDASTVSVALVAVTGSGTLSGTTSVAAVNGRAVFTDLKVTGTGTFKLRASRTGLLDVDSAEFTMTPRAASPYLALGADGKDLGYDKSLVDDGVAVALAGDRRGVAEPRDSAGSFAYDGVAYGAYPNTLLNTDMPSWTDLQTMTQHSVSGDTALRALHSAGTLDTGGHIVILDNLVTYSSSYYGTGGANWPLRPNGDAAPGGTNQVIYISKAIWDSMVANGGVATVCPEKVRVTSADDANLATFAGPDTLSGFLIKGVTKGIRFVGIKVTLAAGTASVGHLASLGSGTTADQPDATYLPSNLGFDRCRFDGHATSEMRHAVELHCINGYVIDSDWGDYIRCTTAFSSECHGIIAYNGPGPYRIINNRVNGGSQSMFFGGAREACGIVADVEVRYNLMTRPLTWNPNDPSYGGTQYAVKNIFELKKAKRVIAEYNVLENVWVQGQDGACFLLKSESYGDGFGYTSDVTVRHNWCRNAPFGVNMTGVSNVDPAVAPERMIVYNNLFEIGGSSFPPGGDPHGQMGYTSYCGFIHNTFISKSIVNSAIKLPDANTTQLSSFAVVKDNIHGPSSYGFKGSNAVEGNFSGPCPNATTHKNVVTGRGANASTYPADTEFPATEADIGYTDAANGDYSLYGTSQNGVGGVATKLAVITQPTTGSTGQTLAPAIVVEVQDANSLKVSSATDVVTLGGSAALGGTVSRAAVVGRATFDTVTLSPAGTYSTLSATATGLTAATLASIVISDPPAPVGGGGASSGGLTTLAIIRAYIARRADRQRRYGWRNRR